MHKGDIVIADHPERKSRKVKRFYGVVREITPGGNILIELADGSMIKRASNSVAVYIQPPPNWKQLYKQKKVAVPRSRKSFFPASTTQKKSN